MPIKPEILYYFLVFARCLHMTKAADQIGITQQTLSTSLAKLEAQLGQRLIQRQSQPPHELTPAGRLLAEQAGAALKRLENFYGLIQGLPTSKFRIGFQGYPFGAFVESLAQFMKQPNCLLRAYIMSQSKLEEALHNRQLELGIATQPPEMPFASRCLYRGNYVIAAAMPDQIPWQDLDYLMVADSRWKSEQQEGWDEQMYPRQVRLKLSSFQTAIRLCRRGLGALYLPELYISEELERHELFCVAKPPEVPVREVWAMWSELTPDVATYLNLLTAQLNRPLP